MRTISSVVLFLVIGMDLGSGQSQERQQEQPRGIEDNSFLVEEAYNQEAGVVQHISSGMIVRRNLMYSFTQEWPLGEQAHQLSITIPYLTFDSFGTHGIGDILINYRYHMLLEEHGVAFAPRLSVMLPSGNRSNGTGWGVIGFQTNLPASVELSREWVTHFNLGATILPKIEAGGATSTLFSASTAASVIWLVEPEFNLILESVFSSNAGIEDDGRTTRESEFIFNPAVRGAINVGELQIVPGVGIPISFKGSIAQAGVFVYLSFEHPF